MKIDVFSIMRNEEDLLPYFLRHYETFADRIFIFDSKDNFLKRAQWERRRTLEDYKIPQKLNSGLRRFDPEFMNYLIKVV